MLFLDVRIPDVPWICLCYVLLHWLDTLKLCFPVYVVTALCQSSDYVHTEAETDTLDTLKLCFPVYVVTALCQSSDYVHTEAETEGIQPM